MSAGLAQLPPVRVWGCGKLELPLEVPLEVPLELPLELLRSPPKSPKPSSVRPGYGVAFESLPPLAVDEFADGLVEVAAGVASAEWSRAAMNPASPLATAMLAPAATIRPCMLRLRRAMHELCWREVRGG